MKHLEDNNILTTLNHGFRSGYSCESQLIVTMEDLLQAYYKNTQVDCAILDFSNAFDTVSYKKLLHKLTAYGINGSIHAWLTQFLTARTIQLVLEGETTNQVTVDSGVQQGTVLRPLHILSIRGKSKHYYSLDNTILQQVPSNAYLGITIAEDLKWNLHINIITKKSNSTLGFLRRNLRSCSRSSRRSAYVSLIRPALEYGTVVWDIYQRTDINTIERVQHRAARFITGDYRSREPGCITSMLSDLNLPPVEDRRRNIKLPYFYKVVEGVIQAILPQKYPTNRKPGRNIRGKNFSDFNTISIVSRSVCSNSRGFIVSSCKTDQYKNSFFVKTTLDWDHLRDSFVKCESVEAFRSALESRE